MAGCSTLAFVARRGGGLRRVRLRQADGKAGGLYEHRGTWCDQYATGLWDAKVDRAPVLALTGQVNTQVLGPVRSGRRSTWPALMRRWRDSARPCCATRIRSS